MTVEPPPTPAPAVETPFKPFAEIWLHPRRTVRRLVETDPEKWVILLACLAGVGATLDRASSRNLGERIDWQLIVFGACLLGPLGGLLRLWLYSHLIRWTGTWIGGIPDRGPIRTAVAWSTVPAIVALPLWIPMLVFFGQESFTEETPRLDANPLLAIPLIGIGLVQIGLTIWMIVIISNAVAEVQGFRSAWKGFGNITLAALVVIVPIALILAAYFMIAAN